MRKESTFYEPGTIVYCGNRRKVKPLRGRGDPPYKDRPYCFKTKEYNKEHKVCRSCRHHVDCGKLRR